MRHFCSRGDGTNAVHGENERKDYGVYTALCLMTGSSFSLSAKCGDDLNIAVLIITIISPAGLLASGHH